MALDKLGNPELQSAGNIASERVFDEKAYQLLDAILQELVEIKIHLSSMTELEIESTDVNDDLKEDI